MVDLNGHEAGNGGHSQGTPIAYRDSSTRRDAILRQHPENHLSAKPYRPVTFDSIPKGHHADTVPVPGLNEPRTTGEGEKREI